MVVAQIAKTGLSEKSEKNINELLHILEKDFPETSDLLTASTWADDVANNILGCSWSWHGQRRPYDPEHILSDREKLFISMQFQNNDVVFAINRAILILKEPKAKQWEKAVMLRFLLHFVGDSHMPLHCVVRYNKDFPEGDKGGNEFKIKGDLVNKNDLHALWDSIIGLDKKWFRKPLDDEARNFITSLSEEIMSKYPKESLKETIDLNPANWVNESYLLAIEIAYEGIEPNTIPSDAYVQKSRECACKTLALAGYRLSDILNEIFDK